MINICDKKSCTGCGMCVKICPQNAIVMKEKEYGFFYPEVNLEKCISCNLCVKKCPNNNKLDFESFQQEYYAAWNKNKQTRKNSTSGGIFSLLAEKILENNGVVCGAIWDKDFSVKHTCIEKKAQLEDLSGSKYVQSELGDTYLQIRDYLKNGRVVLFSGTPCQNHALKLFLHNDYENLYTVDLICHGVPSFQIFKKYLMEITNGELEKIENIKLRYKQPCWNFGSVKINMIGGAYQKLTLDDPYFNLFNFNYILRESCHQCRYTNLNRIGDITLADFWGFVPENFKMANYDKGISCCLINTKKGQSLFECIKPKLVFELAKLEDVKRSNQCLSMPFDYPADIQEFWKDYQEGVSIEALNQKYICDKNRKCSIPKFLWLRRLRRSYKWIFKK